MLRASLSDIFGAVHVLGLDCVREKRSRCRNMRSSLLDMFGASVVRLHTKKKILIRQQTLHAKNNLEMPVHDFSFIETTIFRDKKIPIISRLLFHPTLPVCIMSSSTNQRLRVTVPFRSMATMPQYPPGRCFTAYWVSSIDEKCAGWGVERGKLMQQVEGLQTLNSIDYIFLWKSDKLDLLLTYTVMVSGSLQKVLYSVDTKLNQVQQVARSRIFFWKEGYRLHQLCLTPPTPTVYH